MSDTTERQDEALQLCDHQGQEGNSLSIFSNILVIT